MIIMIIVFFIFKWYYSDVFVKILWLLKIIKFWRIRKKLLIFSPNYQFQIECTDYGSWMSILLKYQSDLSIYPLIQSIFPIQLLIFSHLFLNHLMLQYYFIKFSHNFDLSFNILHSMSLSFLYLNLHIIMVTVMTNDYY